MSDLLADPLYSPLSLIIVHILSPPLSLLIHRHSMIQALPSSSPSELSIATNLAHKISVLFNASKAPMGETKRVHMMCSIDQILMHLSRFGPSVIQILSDNNSLYFWIG